MRQIFREHRNFTIHFRDLFLKQNSRLSALFPIGFCTHRVLSTQSVRSFIVEPSIYSIPTVASRPLHYELRRLVGGNQTLVFVLMH